MRKRTFPGMDNMSFKCDTRTNDYPGTSLLLVPALDFGPFVSGDIGLVNNRI
jgi:hypothetical protein